MAKLRLTLACGPYDRTQALRDGTIRPDGIELNYLAHAARRDLLAHAAVPGVRRLRDVAVELHYAGRAGNAPFIAIPVFPSRVFRHGYFFVNTDEGHRAAARPEGQARRRAGIQP